MEQQAPQGSRHGLPREAGAATRGDSDVDRGVRSKPLDAKLRRHDEDGPDPPGRDRLQAPILRPALSRRIARGAGQPQQLVAQRDPLRQVHAQRPPCVFTQSPPPRLLVGRRATRRSCFARHGGNGSGAIDLFCGDAPGSGKDASSPLSPGQEARVSPQFRHSWGGSSRPATAAFAGLLFAAQILLLGCGWSG